MEHTNDERGSFLGLELLAQIRDLVLEAFPGKFVRVGRDLLPRRGRALLVPYQIDQVLLDSHQ